MYHDFPLKAPAIRFIPKNALYFPTMKTFFVGDPFSILSSRNSCPIGIIAKNDIIKLILSIYHNAIGDSRIRCLDALDILSEIRFINSIAELDKVERKI